MNARISAAILLLMAEGMTVAQAMDKVLGAGTYGKVVDDLYHSLRAKAGAK